MSSPSGYDAIVIGSGMGGLAFASIMAGLRKWLVLERHFKIGGVHTHVYTSWRVVLGCRASLRGRDG
jgi:phytoene dehydrogenase-like protein